MGTELRQLYARRDFQGWLGWSGVMDWEGGARRVPAKTETNGNQYVMREGAGPTHSTLTLMTEHHLSSTNKLPEH